MKPSILLLPRKCTSKMETSTGNDSPAAGYTPSPHGGDEVGTTDETNIETNAPVNPSPPNASHTSTPSARPFNPNNMADPFEVRMRFTSQLQHLNASVTSAQKAAQFALKYKDMGEDLHSCILEQLERVSPVTRALNQISYRDRVNETS